MELFSISCTTCKTRLKVREEGAIGQILACPKCGGMVMVKPPEGWQKGSPLPVAADQSPPGLTAVVEVRRPGDTIGDSQFDAVDELLSDAPPKVRPGTVTVAPDAPGLARPRFAGTPVQHHDTPQKHPGDASQKPPANGGRQPADVSAEPANHHPAAERRATPPGIHANGKAGNGAPANGSAKSHQTPGGPAVAEARAKAEADRALPGELPPEPPPIAAARPRGYWIMLTGSMAAGALLAILAVTGVIRVLQNPPRPFAQAGTTNAQANNTALPRPPKPTGLPNTPAPPTPVEPNPSPAIPPETPLPAVPMTPAPAPMTNPPDVAAPTPVAPPQPMATPNPLEPFENILATDTADPFANPEVTVPAVPVDPAEPVPADTEPARPALARPAPRVVDVAARLADPLPGIEASGVPLADFLEFIADFSTIPITLEADALPFVRGSSVSPVTVKASGTTIGAALSAGIKPLGLEAVEADGGLVIRVVEPTTLPMLRYPIADLAAGDEAATELGEALQALVEPGSWTGENAGSVTIDKGDLKIVQRRAAHLALVVLCEKLRTARKLRHKTSFDASLFKLDSRSERARPKLETPISLNYSQPTPFVRIVERLEQAGGVRILVDWRDIASAGWNPDGEATLLVDKEPLSAALSKLLEPMDLAWRVVDHQTLQIVSPQTLNSRSELELYKAADLVTADPSGAALLSQVRSMLGDALFRDAGGPFEIRFDEPSGTLLAALPQPKQQELEALLAKLRDAAK